MEAYNDITNNIDNGVLAGYEMKEPIGPYTPDWGFLAMNAFDAGRYKQGNLSLQL